MRQAPTVREAIQRGRVNVPGMAAAAWWPLFDKQTYDAGGVAVQQFFAVPAGSGGKTETDTNMELSSQIPAGQMFNCVGISLDFFPAQNPAIANATGAVQTAANDFYTVMKTGRLEFKIGSKDYVNHGPLNKFPSYNSLEFDLASGLTTTVAATTLALAGSYGRVDGKMYPMFDTTLVASQSFSVKLYDLPAVSANGVIVVNLIGWLYRQAQ